MFVPAPGAIVAGRYALEAVIGRGGMGEVWRAQDRELESPCAIKFILEHLAKDSALRSRFTREAKTVARLRSPHAVQILGVGEHEGALYLAMELLEGETLHTRLSRVGTLSAEATFIMVEQVAHALQKAHEMGIVHRDLKPDNIWLWSERDVFAKVLDFGVAKTRNTTNSLHTATGMLVGTPHYMSPEQAKGTREVDHRSDLWALAIITIECLTGRRPFESQGLGDLLIQIVATPPPTLRALGADLPLGLQVWWERALAREPERRFQTASELVAELRPHLAPNSKPASMPGSFPQQESQPRLSSEHGAERNSDVARQGPAQPRAAIPAPPGSNAGAAAAARSTPAVSAPRTHPDAAPPSTWVTAEAKPGKAPAPGSMSPLSHTRVPLNRLSKPIWISLAAAAAIGLVLLGVVGARMFSEPAARAESERGSRSDADAKAARASALEAPPSASGKAARVVEGETRPAGPAEPGALPKVSVVPVSKPTVVAAPGAPAGAAPSTVVAAPVPAPAVAAPVTSSPTTPSRVTPAAAPRPSPSRPVAPVSRPAPAPRPPKAPKPAGPSVEDKYGI